MKKRRRLKMEYKIAILLVGFILCVSVTLKCIISIYGSNVEKSVTYTEDGKLTYNACLFSNEFIEEECFSNDRTFVANLLSTVDINLDYKLNTSNLIDYNYTYTITAITTANERGESGNILYSKEDVLTTKTDNGNNSSVNIKDNVKIDYQKYNEIITAFKRNYTLALESNLTIYVELKINGKTSGIDEEINIERKFNIVVPLAEQTVNIVNENNTINNSDSIVKLYSQTGLQSKEFKLSFVLAIDIIYILMFIILIIRMIPKQSEYNRKIKKILKDFDRAIVKAKKLPEFKNLDTIEVDSFEELLDARDNLERPILFYESPHKDLACFSIVDGKQLYVYSFNAYDGDNTDEEK